MYKRFLAGNETKNIEYIVKSSISCASVFCLANKGIIATGIIAYNHSILYQFLLTEVCYPLF